jgi:hypothetical protein
VFGWTSLSSASKHRWAFVSPYWAISCRGGRRGERFERDHVDRFPISGRWEVPHAHHSFGSNDLLVRRSVVKAAHYAYANVADQNVYSAANGSALSAMALVMSVATATA